MRRIDDGIVEAAKRNPEKIALRMDHDRLRYGELLTRICSVRDKLLKQGYSAGDKVALCLENSIGYLVLFLGSVRAGLIVSPINPRLIREEKQHIINALQPVLVVEEEGRQFRFETYETQRTSTETQYTSNETQYTSNQMPSTSAVQSEIFYIGYSSGTTGKPKGICRTHQSWVDSFDGMSIEFGMDSESKLLIPGPLCYSASLIAALHGLFIGGTVELLRQFDPDFVTTHLQNSDINTLFMVPTMYRDIIEVQKKNKKKNIRPMVFITAGDKMKTATKDDLFEIFPNARLFEYYGTSEVGFVSVLKPSEEQRKPGSVGKPFYSANVKCVDGEIWVKSTMSFCGYEGLDSLTNMKKIDRENGWLATTDTGWMDEDGYLYVSGRQHEKMIYGGVNIYPREIEEVLERHPGILEAAVIAIPDPRLGDVPAAAIVWREGAKRDLAAFLESSITPYKRPKFWWSKEQLPRNAAGKVMKSMLLDECKQLLKGGHTDGRFALDWGHNETSHHPY
jgi:long-chain acyl-CoA synthetase